MRLEGGTGKAEDAKLPGAGISPKPCPRKCAKKRSQVPERQKSGGTDLFECFPLCAIAPRCPSVRSAKILAQSCPNKSCESRSIER